MTSIQISSASTADLLAFYNAHSGAAPVRRFADRKSAEARVSKLVERLAAEQEAAAAAAPAAPAPAVRRLPARGKLAKMDREAAKVEKAAKKYCFSTDGCPVCGATADITAGRVIEKNGRQEVIREHEGTCHSCGAEFNVNTGKPIRAPKATDKASISASISATWADPEVAAKRKERTSVRVDGEAIFSSVAKAFAALNIPSNKVISFRLRLKAEGTGYIGGHRFDVEETIAH